MRLALILIGVVLPLVAFCVAGAGVYLPDYGFVSKETGDQLLWYGLQGAIGFAMVGGAIGRALVLTRPSK